ncbi:hypothetical protein [Pontitalea aquivivens]|uniref:hypothetical protein n=1 Tax=Pontitalea aquivivens TaxID=3388663 RepID=UPI0039704A3B
MAFVLGPLLEESLRRAMLLSEGSPSVFVTRPISLALILSAAGCSPLSWCLVSGKAYAWVPQINNYGAQKWNENY